VIKRSGASEPFSRSKIITGVRKACQGRPVGEDDLARLAQRVEEQIRSTGAAEVDAHEIGLSILGPLRELDEVAFLRFASVYQAFDSLEDFEVAIIAGPTRTGRSRTGRHEHHIPEQPAEAERQFLTVRRRRRRRKATSPAVSTFVHRGTRSAHECIAASNRRRCEGNLHEQMSSGARAQDAQRRREGQAHGLTVRGCSPRRGSTLRPGDLGAARCRPDELGTGETIFEQKRRSSPTSGA
jgi:hypothetical protein